MGKTIKIKVEGRSADTDAPTAEDLLDQIRDVLDILRGVESAMADDGGNAIDWRVINATKASPLSFELQAFPRQYAVNVGPRVEIVTRRVAEGMKLLQDRAERPLGFTDKVIAKAEKVFERVTNGLSLTEITFGDDLPPVVTTPTTARAAARNAHAILKPADKPYREFGTIEGTFHRVQRDGYGRKLLYITHRISGEEVKCVLQNEAVAKIEHNEIADVFRGKRLLVRGIIYYRGLGRISQIEAVDIDFLRPRGELPSIDDLVDEEFTGGLSSEEYLERLRDGRLT
jgi:hypothetical protein